MEYSIWYRTNRGASHARFFQTEEALLDVVKTFKRDAVIKIDGKLYGRVWKQDTRWNWYIGEAAPQRGGCRKPGCGRKE